MVMDHGCTDWLIRRGIGLVDMGSLIENLESNQEEMKKYFRGNVFKLQENLLQMEQVNCPVEHFFSFGVYGRKIFMKADLLVVGKIHAHETLNTLISGECLVLSEEGISTKKSGDIWVSKPGAKRVVYCKTDVVWLTSHCNPSNTNNLEKLENEIIAPDYEGVSLPMDELMKMMEVSK